MRLIFTSEEVPAEEEVIASTAELCLVNFISLYGTIRLPSPFVCYALFDIDIHFFDTDLSLIIIGLHVIEVKRKEVVTVTTYVFRANF